MALGIAGPSYASLLSASDTTFATRNLQNRSNFNTYSRDFTSIPLTEWNVNTWVAVRPGNAPQSWIVSMNRLHEHEGTSPSSIHVPSGRLWSNDGAGLSHSRPVEADRYTGPAPVLAPGSYNELLLGHQQRDHLNSEHLPRMVHNHRYPNAPWLPSNTSPLAPAQYPNARPELPQTHIHLPIASTSQPALEEHQPHPRPVSSPAAAAGYIAPAYFNGSAMPASAAVFLQPHSNLNSSLLPHNFPQQVNHSDSPNHHKNHYHYPYQRPAASPARSQARKPLPVQPQPQPLPPHQRSVVGSVANIRPAEMLPEPQARYNPELIAQLPQLQLPDCPTQLAAGLSDLSERLDFAVQSLSALSTLSSLASLACLHSTREETSVGHIDVPFLARYGGQGSDGGGGGDGGAKRPDAPPAVNVKVRSAVRGGPTKKGNLKASGGDSPPGSGAVRPEAEAAAAVTTAMEVEEEDDVPGGLRSPRRAAVGGYLGEVASSEGGDCGDSGSGDRGGGAPPGIPPHQGSAPRTPPPPEHAQRRAHRGESPHSSTIPPQLSCTLECAPEGHVTIAGGEGILPESTPQLDGTSAGRDVVAAATDANATAANDAAEQAKMEVEVEAAVVLSGSALMQLVADTARASASVALELYHKRHMLQIQHMLLELQPVNIDHFNRRNGGIDFHDVMEGTLQVTRQSDSQTPTPTRLSGPGDQTAGGGPQRGSLLGDIASGGDLMCGFGSAAVLQAQQGGNGEPEGSGISNGCVASPAEEQRQQPYGSRNTSNRSSSRGNSSSVIDAPEDSWQGLTPQPTFVSYTSMPGAASYSAPSPPPSRLTAAAAAVGGTAPSKAAAVGVASNKDEGRLGVESSFAIKSAGGRETSRDSGSGPRAAISAAPYDDDASRDLQVAAADVPVVSTMATTACIAAAATATVALRSPWDGVSWVDPYVGQEDAEEVGQLQLSADVSIDGCEEGDVGGVELTSVSGGGDVDADVVEVFGDIGDSSDDDSIGHEDEHPNATNKDMALGGAKAGASKPAADSQNGSELEEVVEEASLLRIQQQKQQKGREEEEEEVEEVEEAGGKGYVAGEDAVVGLPVIEHHGSRGSGGSGGGGVDMAQEASDWSLSLSISFSTLPDAQRGSRLGVSSGGIGDGSYVGHGVGGGRMLPALKPASLPSIVQRHRG